MPAARHAPVLIVDFGSQVTQLIARRLRESGVYCEIHPWDKAEAAQAALQPAAIILSGGPASAGETTSPIAAQSLFDAGVPMLGICYGADDHAAPSSSAASVEPVAVQRRVRSGRDPQDPRRGPVVRWALGCRRYLSGVDEPRRRHHGHAAGIRGCRDSSENAPYAVIADEARRYYGLHVPSRGGAYAATAAASSCATSLHKSRRADRSDWTMAAFREEAVARDPCPGGRAAGSSAACRAGWIQLGCRGADPRGDRRATHLRLRRHTGCLRHRTRAGTGRRPVPRSLQYPSRSMWTRAMTFLGGSSRASPIPRQKRKDDRPPVHRRVRPRGRQDHRAARDSWRKERSIPTSSRAFRRPAARAR